ncbi:MAG: tRNA threonylcarbamoyladenosine dehydratase, partial [Myxococcota bacterium]|nr:tRNA threonylcarbamoyladenosine dehydratase [Myxococcota bacterium]
YEARLADKLLPPETDFVVDAIDNVNAKCHLLAACRDRAIPVVCSTGASGRWDPTAIEVTDLALTRGDRLGRIVRKLLRQEYDFPRKGPFGIPAVFSTEPQTQPVPLHYDGGNGFHCVCPGGDNDVHTCEERNVIWGTAGFVTGSFGMTAASVVVRRLAGAAS